MNAKDKAPSKPKPNSNFSSSETGDNQEQIERSLREYQEILAAAEEVAKVGSWKWDLQTQKVTWSHEMFRLFAVTQEGFDGDLDRIIADRIHPDDRVAVMESNRKVLEEASPMPMSYRIVLPDGIERTVWAQGKLIHDQAGQPQALIGFVQDITERVRAEKKVIQLKRLYATLSQVNQMIVRVQQRDELFQTICDVAVQFGEFSAAWIGLLDEASGNLLPRFATGLDVKNWTLPIVNIHSGPLSKGLISQAIHTSRVTNSADVQANLDSQILPAQLQGHEFHSSAVIPFRMKGQTIGALTLIAAERGLFKDTDEIHLLEEMGLDISFALDNMENDRERKQAEEALRRSEENFSKAFASSPVGLMITRINDGKYMEMNEAYANIVGYSREDLIGHLTTEFNIYVYPEQRDEILNLLRSAGALHNYEAIIRNRAGDLRTVLASLEMIEFNSEACIITTLIDLTERKKAEMEIQSLSKFPAENPNPVFRINRDGVLLYANQSSQPLLNLWMCKVGAQLPDDLRNVISSVLQSGKPKEMEIEYEGKAFWLTFTPIAGGEYINGYGRDITEHKRAEQSLRENEERLRLSLHAAKQGLYDLNVKTGDAVVNNEYAEMLGYDPATFVETNAAWIERLHPDDQNITAQAYADYINGRRPEYRVEFRQRTKNGKWKWILSLGKIVEYDSDGQPLRMLGTHTDITERKQAEDALKRNEHVLRLFVEHSPASIAMFDRNMNYIVASQRYLIDYRLRQQDLTGRCHYDVFPEIPDRWREIHRRCLQGAIEKADANPFPREDGTLDWVRWEIRPWYESSGEIGGIILFSEVITERKQVQDELHLLNLELEQRVVLRTMELSHANRAKDEFLASMSHELRTPLNTVLGLSETLLEQRKGSLNDKQFQSIEMIASSGRHLLGLINDILEISKIEAGKVELHTSLVSVKDICESSLNFIREPALQKLIDVKFDNQSSTAKLYADPQRLKQILINLLTNAVKFTPERGRISLAVYVSAENDQILFSVTDTGIGIAVGDLKKLFTPFTQLDSSLTRQYTGTGLGLALVRKLTELHGGSVKVESEVGGGSRFTVILPLRQNAGETETNEKAVGTANLEPAPGPEARAPKERQIVLLAEDNEINAEMVLEYLESRGYQVILAQDGEEVLKKAQATPPDIILMDIQMPKMDGLEATRRLRADPRFESTPIIALTALAMPGDKESSLEAGVNEYLSKPVSLKKLAQVIDHLTKTDG